MKKLFKILITALLCIMSLMMLIFVTSPKHDVTVQVSASDSYEMTSADEDKAIVETPEATDTPETWREVTLCGKTFSTKNRKLDLSNIKPSDVDAVCEVLPEMKNLVYVDIGTSDNGLTFDDLDKLFDSAPNAKFSYRFELYGQTLNTYDKVLDFNHYEITDNADELMTYLPYMRNLRTLDMDSCGIGNERMAEIRDSIPDVEVIWRIWFGSDYSVRTNVEKILASKPSWGGTITNEDAQQLKYCTKLKFLDLGHNDELTDFSFVSELEDLRIAVISITGVSDLTPFSNCKKLYYLEAGNTKVSDLSPLAECPNLQHLNVGTCSAVNDITPLYDLNLKRLWLGSGDPVPSEQVAKMQELHPGIEIDTTCPTGLEGGTIGVNEGFVMGKWKSYKQYLAADWVIYEYTGSFPAQHPKGIFRIAYDAFEYALNPACYSFIEYDPLYYEHGSIYETTSGTPVDLQEDPDGGKVIYLTNDTENIDAWISLGEKYTEETGVPVTVKTGEDLSEALTDIDAPTLFEINGAPDVRTYGESCFDLTGTDAYKALTSEKYAATKGGEVLGIAKSHSCYGILVNKNVLEKLGIELDSITDYESLSSAVSKITNGKGTTNYESAFVSGPMNDITETAMTNRLALIPITLELNEEDGGLKDILEGKYLDGFHKFWDLYIYNMCCSYYDISPAAYVQRTNKDSCNEFIEGDAAFFVCGSEIWEYIEKDGRLSADDIAIIPVYMGYDDEKSQGLCESTDWYWAVNKDASEENINATVDFLNWLTTSDEAAAALYEMGYTIPYQNAVKSDNPLIEADREMTASGKIPINTNYSVLPSESWRDEVNYEMAAYSANLGDWSDIYGEIATVWAGEYAIK